MNTISHQLAEGVSTMTRNGAIDTKIIADGARRSRGTALSLASPFAWRRKSMRWWNMLAVAVITGLLGGAVSTPEAGVGLFLAVLACMAFSWGRIFLTLTTLTTVVATGAYMVYRQAVEHFLPGAGWAPQFAIANTLTWIAVIFLAADAMITAIFGAPDDEDSTDKRE